MRHSARTTQPKHRHASETGVTESKKEPSAIPAEAIAFAKRDIERSSRQAMTAGPSRLLRKIHDSSRGEHLAKHPAARMANIVDGMTGNKAPTIAKPTSSRPPVR